MFDFVIFLLAFPILFDSYFIMLDHDVISVLKIKQFKKERFFFFRLKRNMKDFKVIKYMYGKNRKNLRLNFEIFVKVKI